MTVAGGDRGGSFLRLAPKLLFGNALLRNSLTVPGGLTFEHQTPAAGVTLFNPAKD